MTYGAGGGTGEFTTGIAADIQKTWGVPTLAHLTCVSSTREHVLKMLDLYRQNGIENILALRGDYTEGVAPQTDFRYASELCAYIRRRGGFDIGGACYPESHMDSADEIEDVLNLKKKVDAGAQHLISQLFFDNELFYRFMERAKIAGINVPVEAGIMPVTNKRQIERMVKLCGVALPKKFMRVLEKYEHNEQALRDAGIAYAIDQITDLIAQGADGIHLYTMNNPYIAHRIYDAVHNLISVYPDAV